MYPPISSRDTSYKPTANTVVDGISDAMDKASVVAGQAGEAVASLRDNMRRSPLTTAALMLSIGYVVGTITHTWPGGRRS